MYLLLTIKDCDSGECVWLYLIFARPFVLAQTLSRPLNLLLLLILFLLPLSVKSDSIKTNECEISAMTLNAALFANLCACIYSLQKCDGGVRLCGGDRPFCNTLNIYSVEKNQPPFLYHKTDRRSRARKRESEIERAKTVW